MKGLPQGAGGGFPAAGGIGWQWRGSSGTGVPAVSPGPHPAVLAPMRG